jgi:hypothetical protein
MVMPLFLRGSYQEKMTQRIADDADRANHKTKNPRYPRYPRYPC